MKLHDLKPAPGSTKNRKRVGRGPGGTDKTAGRGHKGQLSRSGAGKGQFLGGGGSTLISRLPKRGFNNVGTTYEIVNLADLERFEAGAVVDRAALEMAGLVRRRERGVKLLARGEVGVGGVADHHIPDDLVVEPDRLDLVGRADVAAGQFLLDEMLGERPPLGPRADQHRDQHT